MNQKAQTATEYLIILAVVIIIALIVLGVLGAIPGIGGGAGDNQNKLVLATGDIGVSGYKQDSRETSFFLKNNQPNRIKITTAYVGGKKCTLYPTNQTFKPGQEKEIICLGFDSNDNGDSYSYEFNITYLDTKTDATYTFNPDVELRGQVAAGSELHTGQVTCFDTTTGNGGVAIACSDADAIGDGIVDTTAKSYSNLTNNVLLDVHTGLYWTTNESTSINNSVSLTTCGNLTQGGFSDWRLPNINEFITVLDHDAAVQGSAMNPSPGNNWAAERYWVSTTNATGDLYYVTLTDDGDSKGYFTGSSPVSDGAENSVCVRGSTTAISLIDSPKNFKNNGDGTVSDLNTGLVWQQNDSDGTLVWNDSVVYCDDLDMSGYTDWRLPTVSEATTFIDYGSSNYRDSAFTSGHDYY